MNFESAKSWTGQTVDNKFPLLRWLGGSDHSAIFLTEMGSANAVIKLVDGDTLDANLQLLRWQQVSQLSHPCLLRLFTLGRCQIGGAPLLYLVMDYAEESLSEILLQRPLTTEETRSLLQSVVEALAYLHAKGFVHGRIQPSNVLAQGNQIKLTLDAVRAPGDPSARIAAGNVYDAPELKTHPVSPTADLWSLGVTLVAALTQHPVVDERATGDPSVPRNVPEPFRSIARECLRQNPAQRCTLSEIEARLESTRSISHLPSTESTSSRLRIMLAVAATLLLAAVFVGPKLLSHHEASSSNSTGTGAQPMPSPRLSATSPPAKPNPIPPNNIPTRTSSKGEVVHQVLPAVPQSARNTIHGKIRVGVRVQVDPSGKVTSTTLASPGPSKYFAKLALKAAQQWRFASPQQDGQPVATTWLLRFQFGRTGTQVFPALERR
jgi:TonB family protein